MTNQSQINLQKLPNASIYDAKTLDKIYGVIRLKNNWDKL